MAAGGGDRQRVDDVDVAADVGEVGVRPGRRDAPQARLGRWRPVTAAQDVGDLGERARADDVEPVDERRLGGALARDDEPVEPLAHGALGDREHAAARPQLAAQRELAEDREALERAGGDLAARREDAARDREVEAGPRLAQVRGREVDGDARAGNSKPEFRIAARTRSRASRTARSPSPTIVNAGSPARMSTSTVTRRGSSPSMEKVVTWASTAANARGGRVTAKPRICTNSAPLLRRNRVISAPLRRGCRGAASRHGSALNRCKRVGPLSHASTLASPAMSADPRHHLGRTRRGPRARAPRAARLRRSSRATTARASASST